MTSIGFAPGTRVLTAEGSVPIEQVAVGSLVLSAGTHDDESVPRRVVAVKRGLAQGVVHTLWGTDAAVEFVVAGWDQQVFAVQAEPWVYGHDTPGWIALGERPADLFLRSSTRHERIRLEQVAFVHRTATATRGFIAPNRMDQALGAWLDFSGPAPQAIPHTGNVTWERAPGLVVNDLDIDSLPEDRCSYACETFGLRLEGEHGFFVGARKLFVLVKGAG